MKAVTCIGWVPRGISKSNPDKITLSEKELADLMKNMSTCDTSDQEDGEETKESSKGTSKDSRKRKLSDIATDVTSNGQVKPDVEPTGAKREDDSDGCSTDGNEEENPLSLGGIAYYPTNAEDPYMKKETDSEDEDDEILPTDNLIAVGKVNKDFCNLEVYVYNEEENNCWCHHDYILPTIPLCLEWMNFDPCESKSGNFVAVGTMGPDIELWDLDVLETVEATIVLKGSESKPGNKKKKRKKKGHSDAVLDLSWNKIQPNALASASADFTLALWDLEGGHMVTSFLHNEKVQCAQWQPSEVHSILSGSADKTVRLFDCRTLDPGVQKWSFDGEIENVKWDHANDSHFLASTDQGKVFYMDCRSKVPIFQLNAHEESVTGICFSSKINGCMVTTGADKIVKVWDIRNSHPEQVYIKDLDLGQLFCVSACPEAGLIFGVGGERELRVLNFDKLDSVKEHFSIEHKATAARHLSDDLVPGSAEVTIGYSDEDEAKEEDDEPKTIKKKKKKKSKHQKVNQS